MLKLIGVARSRNFRCLWAAEEAGIRYEHVATPFTDIKLPAHLALNPNGKLPAMQDGALVLFESLAINLHIAAKTGAKLLPTGDDHARVLQWTLWAATEAEPNIMQWARHSFMLAAEQRDPEQAATGRAASDARLAVLEGHLAERDWLVGDGFSIADCNLAGVYYGSWFNGYDFTGFPLVTAWLDRCLNRPAALAARKLRETPVTDAAGFTARLQAEGYTEILTREIAPGVATPQHSHPYDTRGLTVAGHFVVVAATGMQQCPVGEYFELTAGTPHTEASGPAGATLLIGRRPQG